MGVTGSIAAYKIANLASMLVKQHADVNVIMTHNATNFINPITFETLTGNKCLVDTFDRNFEFNVEHVALAKRADIFMVAPASANVIGKMANGIADDMLTTTILAAKCPKLVSPAMNTNMYENRIVQDNIKKLEHYGFEMIKPAEGYLACGDTGAGKMPEPQTLFNYIIRTIACEKDLAGKKRTHHSRSDTGKDRPGTFYHQSLNRQDGTRYSRKLYAPRRTCYTGQRLCIG